MTIPASNFASNLPLETIDKFSKSLAIVEQSYIDEVDTKQLMEYALEGMLENLDPHSVYLNEESLSQLNDSTNGAFGGLGVEVSYKEGQLTIISPMDRSPAALAGIESGDLIYSIEDTLVEKLSLKDAISRLKGEPGTSVKIKVSREGNSQLLDFDIKREVISVPSATSEIIDGKWGYMRLSSFTDKASSEILSELETLVDKNVEGLIFDLRNNPGGLLRAASQISNYFLEEGAYQQNTIVSVSGRDPNKDHSEVITGPDITGGLPLVVLVNSGSASASEVVAGALQDYRRAVIMGKKTFGKGSVQTVIPVENCALKLTTARYFTPNGRSIQAKGITPDIVISSNWKKVDEQEESGMYSEANLSGHLKAEEQNSTIKSSSETINALKDEYIIQQAIDSLKVMQF